MFKLEKTRGQKSKVYIHAYEFRDKRSSVCVYTVGGGVVTIGRGKRIFAATLRGKRSGRYKSNGLGCNVHEMYLDACPERVISA